MTGVGVGAKRGLIKCLLIELSLIGREATAPPAAGSEAYISGELQEDQGSSSVLGVKDRRLGNGFPQPYPSLQYVYTRAHVQ